MLNIRLFFNSFAKALLVPSCLLQGSSLFYAGPVCAAYLSIAEQSPTLETKQAKHSNGPLKLKKKQRLTAAKKEKAIINAEIAKVQAHIATLHSPVHRLQAVVHANEQIVSKIKRLRKMSMQRKVRARPKLRSSIKAKLRINRNILHSLRSLEIKGQTVLKPAKVTEDLKDNKAAFLRAETAARLQSAAEARLQAETEASRRAAAASRRAREEEAAAEARLQSAAETADQRAREEEARLQAAAAETRLQAEAARCAAAAEADQRAREEAETEASRLAETEEARDAREAREAREAALIAAAADAEEYAFSAALRESMLSFENEKALRAAQEARIAARSARAAEIIKLTAELDASMLPFENEDELKEKQAEKTIAENRFAFQGDVLAKDCNCSFLSLELAATVMKEIKQAGPISPSASPKDIQELFIQALQKALPSTVMGTTTLSLTSEQWDNIYKEMMGNDAQSAPLPFDFAWRKVIISETIKPQDVIDFVINGIMDYKGLNIGSPNEEQLIKFRALLTKVYSDGLDPDTFLAKEPLKDLAMADSNTLERLFRKSNNIYTLKSQKQYAEHQDMLENARGEREDSIKSLNPAPVMNIVNIGALKAHETYPVIIDYLATKQRSATNALHVNFDQVRRDPFFCQQNLPEDPSPFWEEKMLRIMDSSDRYTSMYLAMIKAVQIFYNRPVPDDRIDLTERKIRIDLAESAIRQLFTHYGDHAATGRSPEWRQRIARVYNELLEPNKLFVDCVIEHGKSRSVPSNASIITSEPSLALIQLLDNQNCIDGARQVLNSLEGLLGDIGPMSFAQRIGTALRQARDQHAYNAAIDATKGSDKEQNETLLHFKNVGIYGLSLSGTSTQMEYTGLAKTSRMEVCSKTLDHFFAHYTPNTMIEDVKIKFKPTNRSADDQSSFLFVDEIIEALQGMLKYSNHTYAEIRAEAFTSSDGFRIDSIQDSTIEDLLVHYGYLIRRDSR